MRIAVDTNVLVYAAGIGSDERRAVARAILLALSDTQDLVIPLQVVGEMFNVLCKKGGASREIAYEQVRWWQAFMTTARTTETSVQAALELAVRHKFAIWDA